MAKSTAKKTSKKTAAANDGPETAVADGTRFEDALDELETLVGTLETGDQSLEDSLAQFERGISLARYCQKSLADAEQKISVLMNLDVNGADAELQDFPVEDSTDHPT